MNKKIVGIVAGMVLTVMMTIFVTPAVDVFADMSAGGGTGTSGAGAGSGCNYEYSTCYGATWRWYPWPAGATSVTIPGGSRGYVQSFTISGTDAQVCAKAGGYYRYGMVKTNGEQYGGLPISGNSSNTFNSSMLGGGMHYRGPGEANGGVDWNTVAAAYNAAAAANHFTRPGLVAGSNLMWFCSSQSGGGGGGGGTNLIASCDNWKPASYNSNVTSIITKVKNLAKPEGYSNETWAGPGQTVQWLHCYYPGVQKMASATVTKNNKKPGTWTCDELIPNKYGSGVNNAPTIQSIFKSDNGAFSSVATFQNFFTVKGGSNNGSFSRSFTGGSYGVGVSNVQSRTDNYSIGGGNVKDTLWENATTGYPTSVSRSVTAAKSIEWKCPYYKYVLQEANHCKNCDVCGKKCKSCNCHPVIVDSWCNHDTTVQVGCEVPEHAPSGTPCQPVYQKIPCHDTHYEYETQCDECCTNVPCQYEDIYGYKEFDSWSQNGNEFISWSVNNSTASSDKAYVKTPINYAISSSINIGNTIPYSGEQASVGDAKIYNNSKWNSATMSSYATSASNVWYRLITYTSSYDETNSGWTATGNVCSGKSNCTQSEYTEIKQAIGANSSYSITGKYGSVNVPDISAGNYICVALAYWPTSSGSDTNMGNYNGDGQWGVSNPSCKVIAKKPNFQVWGGGVYSAGAISLNAAYKTNLAGVSGRGYSVSGKSNTTVFGSWVEQAVSGAKTIAELASGSSITNGSFEGNGYTTGYCTYRTPLSFANYSTANLGICPNQQKTGNMGAAANVTDRKGMVETLAKGGVNTTASTININNSSQYVETTSSNGKKTRYTYGSAGFTLSGATVASGVTHVVRSDGDITISGNIDYQDAAYSALEQIPKLVIYAKNIYINCSVKRVDAVLLAENDINTCSNSGDINAQANSNQLKIRGAIVANKLKLNRTYGATTGTNSKIPAEIIDYDTSLILWAALEMDVSDTYTLNVTYQRELAPRY